MTDFFNDKVTIYISIPAVNDKPRCFQRRIIEKCLIQRGFVNKMDGSIQNIANALTVITKDIERYMIPGVFYSTIDKTDEVLQEEVYTAYIGDFIVLGEVYDVVESAQEFANLQQKYKNNGFKVTTINPFINGLSVDNITISNI